MKLEFGSQLSANEYRSLYKQVGWKPLPADRVQAALLDTFAVVVVRLNYKPIAMGSCLWDGGDTAFLLDIIVTPPHQRQGLGRQVVQRLLDAVKNEKKSGSPVQVQLIAGDKSAAFYRKLGFSAPNSRWPNVLMLTLD